MISGPLSFDSNLDKNAVREATAEYCGVRQMVLTSSRGILRQKRQDVQAWRHFEGGVWSESRDTRRLWI